MKLSSLKLIIGGAVIGYVRGLDELTITSYDVIDGSKCFPDKEYLPRTNPEPQCTGSDPNEYQQLLGGSGVLTNGVIATLTAFGLGEPTEGEKYVCWDFREFSVTMGQAREFPIVLRFAEDVTVNEVYVSVDDKAIDNAIKAPGKVRVGMDMEEYVFPSNPNIGGVGPYTGEIPLTTPIDVSAGEDFVVTIVGTEDEGECTSIGFENPPGICPTVCLSEIQVFGTISSGDSSRSRSKASKSKASKGSKAKVRKLNYV